MIFLGGLTRLTNAGLSIVEWKPISGIIPPLTSNHWQNEFDKYKTSPEYQQLNNKMSLADFKFIFWLEFVHRFIGRVSILIYLIPLLYFYKLGVVHKSNILAYIIIFILFVTQGFIGWYMVKSGLAKSPYVSHFRLALHLIIAFFIYTMLFWQFLLSINKPELQLSNIGLLQIKYLNLLSILIVYLQVILGALVAGLDAGLIYNSFPLMDGSFIAEEISSGTIDFSDFFYNLSNPIFVQFLHRIGAYCTILIVITFCIKLCFINNNKICIMSYCTILVLLLQTLAGIITIIYAVPITVALIHQIGAILLLSCLLWCYHSTSHALQV